MYQRTAVIVLTLVLLLLPSTTTLAQATNPPYLSQFPSVERVKAEIKGRDPIDTSARQVGALYQLVEIIKKLAGLRFQNNEFTRDEDRVKGHYFNAWQRSLYKENLPPAQDQPRWDKLREFYENDPKFLDELMKRFFSPEFRIEFYRTTRTQPPTQQVSTGPRATADRVVSASTQTPQLSGAARTARINFNGVYRDRSEILKRWLRFYEDGAVIGATTGSATPEQVEQLLRKPTEHTNQVSAKLPAISLSTGRFKVQGSLINFSLIVPDSRSASGSVLKGGTIVYSGTIGENSLRVNWHSFISGHSGIRDYEFIPLPAVKSSRPVPSATDIWSRTLLQSDAFSGRDGFLIMFVSGNQAHLHCSGSILVDPQPYTVETRGNSVVINVATSPKPLLFELQPDGSLRALNLHTINFRSGKQCRIDVLTPLPLPSRKNQARVL